MVHKTVLRVKLSTACKVVSASLSAPGCGRPITSRRWTIHDWVWALWDYCHRCHRGSKIQWLFLLLPSFLLSFLKVKLPFASIREPLESHTISSEMTQDRTWSSDPCLVLLLAACLTHCSHCPGPDSPSSLPIPRASLPCCILLPIWEPSWKKSPVVCVLVSRQHVWLRRKCMRGDERHVKVPGFWRSINLPIRPEITWPDLTLPACLCPKREEEWEEGRTESVSRWKREWNIMDGTCEWVYLMEECLFDLQPAPVQNIWTFDCYMFYETSNWCP